MIRNNPIGFQADLHGKGGWWILADGTKQSCDMARTEQLLIEIHAAYISKDYQHDCSDIGHIWSTIKWFGAKLLKHRMSYFSRRLQSKEMKEPPRKDLRDHRKKG